MSKTALVMVASLLAVRFASASVDDQVITALNATGSRQRQALDRLVEKPYPPSGMWRHENFALAAYSLNERVKDADKGIVDLRTSLFPETLKSFEAGGFHWHAYLQQRIYFLFSSRSTHHPGRMGLDAEAAILDMMWQWAAPVCRKEMADTNTTWLYWGSENHHLMAWVSFWGAAHIFAEHPDYRDRRYADGHSPAQMARAFDNYFARYATERATKGLLVEIASPTYAKYSLNTWYNLFDFADDPVLKKRMGMLLDVYWADWALEQIDGVRGGSRHRCYPGRASNESSGGAANAWYHFGIGTGPNVHPGVACAMTTSWRPSHVVAALALDTQGRGDYEYISRRPGLKEHCGIRQFVKDPTHPMYRKGGVNALSPDGGSLLRTSWCTPDFVMGMSQVRPLKQDDWTAICGQNRWNGIVFGGHPTARIFTQPLQPKRGSVYNAEWGVQKRGTMILQRLRESNAQGQMVWFDNSLKPHTKDGWIFVDAPRAYAAIRVVRGKTEWKEDFAAQRRDGKGRDGLGKWLVLDDPFSPIIIEAGRKKDYKQIEQFKKEVSAGELRVKGNMLRYDSALYDTSLTLPMDATDIPTVDGEAIDFEPAQVYDSPYLSGDYGAGVITIRRGDRSLRLDFTQD